MIVGNLFYVIAICVVCHKLTPAEADLSGTHTVDGMRVTVSSALKNSHQTLVKHAAGWVLTKGIRVYYQTATVVNSTESKLPILLLHGAAFSSQTWKKLGTLRFLARQGYSPIAVDLPGYGKTRGYFRGNTNDFMDELIADLGIEKPIVVSPSMSGRYSIPYVLERSENLRGYIPVAPSNYGGTKEKFSKLTLPALVIYGSRDFYGRRTSEIIASIPGSFLKVIPDGSHPAYLDNPKLFHTSVKNFLDGIYAREQQMEEVEKTEGSADATDRIKQGSN